MATYNKIQQFVEDVAEKVHNLGADVLKVALSNTAVLNTNATISAITQITGANGYTTGGTAATISSSVQTSGTYKLILADVVFTASGAMGPFRYVILYNDTPTSPADPTIAWWDYGSSISLATGESFTTDFDASNGVLTIA